MCIFGRSFGGQPFVREEVQQWILASLTSSLYGVRDHTLQLAEGIFPSPYESVQS